MDVPIMTDNESLTKCPLLRGDEHDCSDAGCWDHAALAEAMVNDEEVLAGGPVCARCDCTQHRACPGGCAWLEIEGLMEDVCTACATPEELEKHEAAIGAALEPVRSALRGGSPSAA